MPDFFGQCTIFMMSNVSECPDKTVSLIRKLNYLLVIVHLLTAFCTGLINSRIDLGLTVTVLKIV